MIEQQLANINFVGKDGFIWWIGQIPTEGTWSANIPGRRTSNASQHKGFGYRYKVRIMGYHTYDKTILPDDDLPWASVMFPVTAGSGSGGASQSPNLRQGDFVYGFFMDGENSQVPIIMGVIGNNQYTGIAKNADSKIGYTPFGGFTPTDNVPSYSIPVTPQRPGKDGVQERSPGNPNQPPSPLVNSGVGLDNGIKEKASEQQKEDGEDVQPVRKNSDCEPIPLSEIQIRIQNLIKKIEKIRKRANSWEAAVIGKINNIQGDIDKAINEAAEFITGGMKWIITETQKQITNKINNGFKDTYYNIFPNQRPELKKAVENANDIIACLFRKIIGSLLGIVKDFLLQVVDRFITTPLCAVENFIGSLLGQLSGIISSTVRSILGPISSIVGAVFDIAGSIFNIITNLLSFISCDEQPSCSPLTTWSTWNGTISSVSSSVQNIVNQVESVASTVTQAVNDIDNFNFEFDFASLLADTCNVGPLFCGPPQVQFIGGGGSGSNANAIINSVGQILSIDILSEGSGYQSPPIVSFVDGCGKGVGATGTAVLGPVTTTGDDGTVTTSTGVVEVIMTNPGTGYLPQQDGSLGGDGRTWANPEDSYILRSGGTYDSPYQPGDIMNIRTGDTVYLSGSNPYVSTVNESISAPSVSRNVRLNELSETNIQDRNIQNENASGDGRYPVILELSNIIIDNTGFNYSPNDRVVISPDNGASAVPTFNDAGALINIDLVNNGYGFKEFPDIYIESDTGYNARLLPILNALRIGSNNIPDQVTSGDKIISVVDCVGKI
jgi:hypothetical protein